MFQLLLPFFLFVDVFLSPGGFAAGGIVSLPLLIILTVVARKRGWGGSAVQPLLWQIGITIIFSVLMASLPNRRSSESAAANVVMFAEIAGLALWGWLFSMVFRRRNRVQTLDRDLVA